MSNRIAVINFVFCLIFSSVAFAFNSGSTGADGVYNPTNPGTATTVFFNMSSHPTGFYNFSAFTVPSNITVKFIKNSNNTPVTILSRGNVTINGTIDVSGTAAGSSQLGGIGGPGGFDGGDGGKWGYLSGWGLRGKGPGGGTGGDCNCYGAGAGGGFQQAGTNGPGSAIGGGTYGEAKLNSLIGGSGGGGSGYIDRTGNAPGKGGGGGGGAILIASNGTIYVIGKILAIGGKGGNSSAYESSGGGGGSGGAIRLVADTIAGNGEISAYAGAGGNYSYYGNSGAVGGYGYIRFEYFHLNRDAATITNPAFSGVQSTDVLNMTLPTLAISSIGGTNVPNSPKADYNYPDVTLPYGAQNPIIIGIAASHLPLNTVISVKVSPSQGTPASVTSTPLSGADASSTTATAQVSLTAGTPALITLSASYLVTADSGNGPLFAEGEKVKEVRVSSSLGKAGTQVVYVTESGREIPAKI